MGYRNLNELSNSPQRNFSRYFYFGQFKFGGQSGVPSATAGEGPRDKARTAAASSSNIFFTVNSLLKWELHRDNVASVGLTRGFADLFKVPRNVTR